MLYKLSKIHYVSEANYFLLQEPKKEGSLLPKRSVYLIYYDNWKFLVNDPDITQVPPLSEASML